MYHNYTTAMTCRHRIRTYRFPNLSRFILWCISALGLFLLGQVSLASSQPPSAPVPRPRALILDDPALTDNNGSLNTSLEHTLTSAGYQVAMVSVEDLQQPEALSTSRCALLVLPAARRSPAVLAPLVNTYAQRGGNLLVLGAPAWQKPATVRQGGSWRTTDEAAEATALMPPTTTFLDFRQGFPLNALIRGAKDPQIATKTEIVPTGTGPNAGRVDGALQVTFPDLDGWDMWRTPDLPQSPFQPGETVTVFSARGGPRTHRLGLEWNERDGTRWIAVIPLTPQWRRYRLTPADFHPWDVSAERAKAGFHPENAIRLVVGLAFTHTGQIRGPQQYWLAGVGTEAITAEDSSNSKTAPVIPALETIAPNYKFSPTSPGTVRLVTSPETALVSSARWENQEVGDLQIASSPPRATGAGFRKGRSWRWQPLMIAREASSGQWRGVPGTLVVHKPDGGAPFAGGTWASFAIGNPEFYQQEATQKLIGEIARRIRTGLFLMEGGADSYTLLPGQKVQLGATLANTSAQAHPVTVRITIAKTPGDAPLWEQSWNLEIPARSSATTSAVEWTPPSGSFPEGGYVVTTELREGKAATPSNANSSVKGGTNNTSNANKGKPTGTSRAPASPTKPTPPALPAAIDRVQHRLYLWTPPTTPAFITIGSDGHFHRSGALWRAYGVNYTPSSGIAQEDEGLYQRWMDPAAYDQETVERDLYHIEELGFNAVSAWVYAGEVTWQNLLDFLRRCRAHNLKVSLMLAPDVSSPAAADGLKALFEKFRLPENDTLFAYEIAWEPEFNGHDARRSMDDAWEKWVMNRYGSLAAAERAWGSPIPREGGKVSNPSDEALARPNGPQARLVVDYRRFLDDWVAKRYGPIVQRLHEIDPHHAVSFRMNHAGDPTNRGGMPYAFEGASRAVDFLSPEAYGRVGDWERVKPGWFTAAYARAVAPTKPVVWAEVGSSVWDTLLPGPEPEQVAFQGRFYEDFLRMATASGADGVFFWWFPGGFRFGEGSDYGLLNPDGTDRPAAQAIRRSAKAFLTAPLQTPDVWFSFDRDAHPDGLVGVYDALSARFWDAIAQGRHPGLRSEPEANR